VSKWSSSAATGANTPPPPTQVNYRANIQAFLDAGVTHILATTAVGSLREEIGRGHLVILDQFIDHTRPHKATFTESFEPHRPVHVAAAEPFDARLRVIVADISRRNGFPVHDKGTPWP